MNQQQLSQQFMDSSDSKQQSLRQQSSQGSPSLDNLIREQISLNQLNSSSSRKYLSRSCWEQQEIDDFFENFHQYIILKIGNSIPLKSKYVYNGRLIDIFESIRKEESAQKRMNLINKQQQHQSSTYRSDEQDEQQGSISSQSPQLLSEAISNNNFHANNNFINYIRTETGNDYGYFQNQQQQQQQQQQQMRRIRTQSCDTADDAYSLQQQQQQFRLNQQQFKLQQQLQPANSLRGRFSRKINIEHQYPNLIQEKRVPLQKQNNFFLNNPLQQQLSQQQSVQSSFSRQSSNNSIGVTKTQIIQGNPFFISQQGKKPRSITINSNQVSINSVSNIGNFYSNNNNMPINKEVNKDNYQSNQSIKDNYQSNKENYQAYYLVNNQNNKENQNPNISNINPNNNPNNNNNNIQQVCNKEFEMAHENLKKRIENIQANVKVSKADFMKRLYQNFAGNPSCQTSIQSIDVSQLPQSNPTTQNNHQIMINQQKSQQSLQQFNENFTINHNTIENPMGHLQNNNLITIVSQPQSRQLSSNNNNNNSNEDHINRNHLNNKFRTFAGRKALAEKEKQPFNQSSISNHPLAEQLRERVKKQWEINRENIVIPQQQIINKNQNGNNNIIQKQFIPFQQQNSNMQQQQQYSFAQNQNQINQMQYKSIKRIY